MYKALIVDDESKSRLTLNMLLAKYCPSINVLAEAASVEEGIAMIQSKDPDLLFLDIQLRDGSGFDILSAIPNIRCKVIFTTAFDHYAIQAFKFSAIDYLLKPIDPDQLLSLCERLDKLNQTENLSRQLQVLTENKKAIKRIALNSINGVIYIYLDEIIRCEADSNYTIFYLKDQSKVIVAKSLKEYEELLSEMNFFRIHKSHLVNMMFIKKYDSRSNEVVLEDGHRLEVARRRKDALMDQLIKTS